MPHWLLHFGFLVLVGGWSFLIGVGLSSDVIRWLQGRKKSGQRSAQRLKPVVVGRH